MPNEPIPGGDPEDPARRRPPEAALSLSTVEATVEMAIEAVTRATEEPMDTSIAGFDDQLQQLTEKEHNNDNTRAAMERPA